MYNTAIPILFIVFNRPDTTQLVFDRIRKARPEYLYIAADGPRHEKEKILCDQVREIVSSVDWDCTVKTLYRSENLGCGKAVSSAIAWFFEQVEMGIVLEDDCLPADSFFGFCSTLLEKYRFDNRIGHIAGSSVEITSEAGYYFSTLTNVWGWAGWRRVWKDYDFKMSSFPEFCRLNKISCLPAHYPFKRKWIRRFKACYEGKIDTWDYQYAYHNLINHYLSVKPAVNLISNIGTGTNATHTVKEHPMSNLPVTEIDLNRMVHPEFVIADIDADVNFQASEIRLSRNILIQLIRNILFAINETLKRKILSYRW